MRRYKGSAWAVARSRSPVALRHDQRCLNVVVLYVVWNHVGVADNLDDFSVWGSDADGHSYVRNLLGRDGWDNAIGRIAQFTDCDGRVQEFRDAVLDLKDKLEAEVIHADTESAIVRLTQMFDQPWARFVDPALSKAQTSPTSGSLIVLWECSDHSIGLHDKGRAKWRLVSGMKEIKDLYDFLEVGDDEEESLDDLELEIFENISTAELLSEEDLERRKLLDESRRAALEQDDEA